MKCLRCGKEIPEEEAYKIAEAGVDPFCSQYCEMVYSGVYIPGCTSEAVFQRWQEKLEAKRREEQA